MTKIITSVLLILAFQCKSQQFISTSTKKADSLFFINQWKNALKEYNNSIEKDSQLNNNALFWNRLGTCYYNSGDYIHALNCYKKCENENPSIPIQQVLFIRESKLYLTKQNKDKAYEYFTRAVEAGFTGIKDLDTSKEFKIVKNEKAFKNLRERVIDNAYPCRKDTIGRQFDFWVGEWDAYVTGTNILAGHSIIQKASGECMILENWTSLRGTYEGKSINFVNPSTGKWEQIWVGSEGRANDNVHRFLNGVYANNVMQFDFQTKDAKGQELSGRFSFFNQGPNQVRQLEETSSDEGKSWATVYDFTYKRKRNTR